MSQAYHVSVVILLLLHLLTAIPLVKRSDDYEDELDSWTPEQLSRLAWATKIAHARMAEAGWDPSNQEAHWIEWFGDKGFNYPAYMEYLKDEDISKYVKGWYPGGPMDDDKELVDPTKPLNPFLQSQMSNLH